MVSLLPISTTFARTPLIIYNRLTFMPLRRITANISKMDILLALAAGAVMCSYFVPTVEAYNPEEQSKDGLTVLPWLIFARNTADSCRNL